MMAGTQFDLSKVSLVEILLLVGFAVLGTAIVSGFSVVLGIAVDGLVAALLGALIGMVAWWFYVVKRKADNDAR